MGLPPSCFYPLQAFRSGGPAALAQVMENFFRSGWDPLVLGGVDGSNAHPNLAGSGLKWVGPGAPYPPKPNPPPHLPPPWAKRLVVELADETADARIQKKGAPGTPENRKPGFEFIIDPTDTTYGKVCFVAKQDLTKQIGSVILENPVTVTNPKIDFVANYGKMRVGTTGAYALELIRNGSTITVEERTGSAAITYDIKTVKFSNGTVSRTIDTGAYTLNGLADNFYSLAYDLKTSGLLTGWTATASSTYTFDLASFTANTVAAFIATAINDIQTNGYLSVSLYRVTTPRTRNALDCDAFSLNQLGQALCAFMAELGVSGLETAVSGTVGTLTKITAANKTGDSLVTESGSTVTVGGSLAVKRGASSGNAYAGGTINSQYGDAGNTGTGEDDLHTFSVPASTLGTDGDVIEFEAFGTVGGSAENARIKVYFGSTAVIDTDDQYYAGDPHNWRVSGTIVRTGAATQRASFEIVIGSTVEGADAVLHQVAYTTPAETLSGAITLKTTGEATTTNMIVAKSFRAKWQPAYPA